VGVELLADRVRAVTVRRWSGAPGRTLELPWSPDDPDAAVAALRDQLGPVAGIGLAVGLAFLHVKQVHLPPVPGEARRRMLALEAERFFPVGDEAMAVALAADGTLAFASGDDRLSRWLAAFARWGVVEAVEPAPASVARALADAAVKDGVFTVAAGPDERGVLELRDGVLRLARRVPSAAGADVIASDPLPAIGAANDKVVLGDFVAAYGAAGGLDERVDEMLLPAAAAVRIRQRRRRRLVGAALACGLAAGFAVYAADHARGRALRQVNAELAAIEPRAAVADSLWRRLRAMDASSDAAADIARRRADPLTVIQALAERLPHDATVLSVRAVGDAWEVEGTARDAAALIPALDADARLADVRFLSASSRFREDDRARESFAIALRVRPRE